MNRDDQLWRCSHCGQWQYGQSRAIRTNRTCNLHVALDKGHRLTAQQGGASPQAQAAASPANATAILSNIHNPSTTVDNQP